MKMLKAKPAWTILVVLVLLSTGGVLFYLKFEGEVPTIAMVPEPEAIGKEKQFTLTLEDQRSGLKEIRVTMQQAGRTIPVLSESFPSGTQRAERSLTIAPFALGMTDGQAVLRVEVRDRSWRGGNPLVLEANVTLDTRPPTLSVLSKFHYLNQGGTGMIVFRASEPLARSAVEVGGKMFSGFPAGDNHGGFVLFAIPHDAPSKTDIVLVAEDRAGNPARTSFPYQLRPKKFRSDTIRVSQEFLQRAMPYFMDRDPALRGELEQIFLRVNRDMRQANEKTIQELCRNTAPEPLWSGHFLRMANAKPMAGFADRRSYVWQDREIDQQTHLGVDLASLVMSPIEAANRGRVVFAGELGIYGDTVLLDHGCGLFSMYSHLSQTSVQAGQMVEKGERVGISGSTGLAGGDHLHFSVLVGGVFVNPVEWWDPHWVKDNVEDKLALLQGATR
jgi:murein DD-endopeptidase MepM/ murein hydrolase activator NlpD